MGVTGLGRPSGWMAKGDGFEEAMRTECQRLGRNKSADESRPPHRSASKRPSHKSRTTKLSKRIAKARRKPHELGLLIHSEVDRAEGCLDVIRSRALTASIS